jgi:outer membrane immunogenic protein
VRAFPQFALALVVSGLTAVTLSAGPEPISRDSKESKEVAAVAPAPCNWTGFYIGANAGGQFGHSEDKDLDDYNFPDKPWGYSESGFSGGGQIGFNWQWRCLVLGPEADFGYMNLDGRGIEPGFPHDTFGKSDSDFFVTFRGRLGLAVNCWLIYATGGGIAVNYNTRVIDTSLTVAGPDSINASKQELDWGYTVGGGIERMFQMWGRRWSLKVEYLYFNLDDQTFSAISGNGFGPYRWRAETEGHIVRGGLNFHF